METLAFSILSFALGLLLAIPFYRLYVKSLIRYLPDQGPLKIKVYLGEDISLQGEKSPLQHTRLILVLKNLSPSEDIHLESYSFRVLGGTGILYQLLPYPQNLVRTLKPGEYHSIEIFDLSKLKVEQLYTIVVRDIYGREWYADRNEIVALRKELLFTPFS